MTTIDETHQPDDAELDAFLRGEGKLSPRLKRLSQPSPPPEVTAAVMAEIEAALAEEKSALAQAANDAHPRRSSRWAMPAAFAASVLVGMMIHTQWRATQERGEAAVAQASSGDSSHPSVTESKPAADGELVAAAAPDSQPSAKPSSAAPSEKPIQAGSVAAPKPRVAPPVRVASAEPQNVTVTGIRASLQQSLNVKRKAVANVEVVTAEDVGKMPDKNVAESLSRVPGVTIAEADKENSPSLEVKRKTVNHIEVVKNDDEREPLSDASGGEANTIALTPPVPAAAAPAMLAPKDAEKPKAWLDRIEKKIERGETHDALEEWEKFRKAYPDFAVPDKLAEKIKALQQK